MFVITKNIHSYVITLYFLYDERPCTYFVLLPFVCKRFLMCWYKKEEQYGEKYITSYLMPTFEKAVSKILQTFYVYLLYIKYQYRNIPMQYISDTYMTDPALKYGRTLLLMSSLVWSISWCWCFLDFRIHEVI